MDETTRVAALRAVSDDYLAARRAADTARDTARVAALEAIAAGMSEASVARLIGIDRLTMRRWQGKR